MRLFFYSEHSALVRAFPPYAEAQPQQVQLSMQRRRIITMIHTRVSLSKRLHKHPMIFSPCRTGYFELERFCSALLSWYALTRIWLLFQHKFVAAEEIVRRSQACYGNVEVPCSTVSRGRRVSQHRSPRLRRSRIR